MSRKRSVPMGSEETAPKRARRFSARLQQARGVALEFMLNAHETEMAAPDMSAHRLRVIERLRDHQYASMPPEIQAEVRAEFKDLAPGDQDWATAVDTLLPVVPGVAQNPEISLYPSVRIMAVVLAVNQAWDRIPGVIRALIPEVAASTDMELYTHILEHAVTVTRLLDRVPAAKLQPIIASALEMKPVYARKAFLTGLIRAVLQTRNFDLVRRFDEQAGSTLKSTPEAMDLVAREVLRVSNTWDEMRLLLSHPDTSESFGIPIEDDTLNYEELLRDAIDQDKLEIVTKIYDVWNVDSRGDDADASLFRVVRYAGERASVSILRFFLVALKSINAVIALLEGIAYRDRADVLPHLKFPPMPDPVRVLINNTAVASLKWWLQDSFFWFSDQIKSVIAYAITRGTPDVLRIVLSHFNTYEGDINGPLEDLANQVFDIITRAPEEDSDDDEADPDMAISNLRDKLQMLRSRGFYIGNTTLAAMVVIPQLFDLLLGEHVLPLDDKTFIDNLVHRTSYDSRVGLPILRRLVDLNALHSRHLLTLLRGPAKNETWIKGLSAKARPDVASQMGRLGYWIDALSAKYDDPDLRATVLNMATTDEKLFTFKVKEPLLTWTCHYVPMLYHEYANRLDPEKARITDPTQLRSHDWAFSQYYSGALVLKYIKLHAEMQRLGLGQHRMQVAEQAVTRAHPGLGVQHVVLDHVHSPSFFASDVRFGWFDMTGERRRDQKKKPLYYWFGHELGGDNQLSGPATHHRIWSTPESVAVHRSNAQEFAAADVLVIAKVARAITRFLSSDAPTQGPDSAVIELPKVRMRLSRSPISASDTDAIRLKHHLLMLGNHDRLPCSVTLDEFYVEESATDNVWIAILLLLLVDLGRVWCRPLRLADPEWYSDEVAYLMPYLTIDPTPRFDEIYGTWVPQFRPRSYARPKNPHDEKDLPVPLDMPREEPPLVWLVAPGRDPTVDPYAPGQPMPFPGRYDHDLELLMAGMAELSVDSAQ